jgi:lysophospholipase L1-like esterase
VNARGLRDDREIGPKTPGERRIVVVGDSVAFGLGVDVADAFPTVLERLLERDDPRTTVLNLSVLSYRTAQEVRLFERDGWALEPDGVVLAFCLNDFDDFVTRPAPEGAVLPFGLRWQAPRRLAGIAMPDPVPGLDRLLLFRTVTERFRVDYYRWVAEDAGRRQRVWDALARLGAGLAARGVPGLVVIVPLLVEGPYPYGDVHEAVAAHAAAAGFAVLDLRAALDPAGLPALRWRAADVLHLNARGHALAAAALAACVRRSDLRCAPARAAGNA